MEKMSTNLKLIKNTDQSVVFDGMQVTIESLVIQNDDLNQYMEGKPDPVLAFTDLIESALFVRKISNSSAEAEKLGAVAENLSTAFENAAKEATEEFGELIKLHANEKNPVALAGVLKNKLMKAIVDELKPANEASPFHEISETLAQLLSEVTKQVGAKPAIDNSSTKGKNFNVIMDGILQDIATANGDSALYTNDIASETGSKEGDEVITISPDITGGVEVNVVWEFKAEKNLSQAAILKEISRAMQNRHAVAGVFVVDREPKNAHWAAHSFHSGNRLILVVDKDAPDLNLIQFGYIWSRWMAFRALETKSNMVDIERVDHLVKEAVLSLKDFSQIKSAHTGIQKSLTDAITWAGSVESALKSKFKEITSAMTVKE
ncbi:hypothetical protein [Candidatus Planktophila dulcis]|uniref:hypothetical protein n=1 Tax=Candidatus Planktophila dulcis TaxID=1884914 RepID=UPI003CEDC875